MENKKQKATVNIGDGNTINDLKIEKNQDSKNKKTLTFTTKLLITLGAIGSGGVLTGTGAGFGVLSQKVSDVDKKIDDVWLNGLYNHKRCLQNNILDLKQNKFIDADEIKKRISDLEKKLEEINKKIKILERSR